MHRFLISAAHKSSGKTTISIGLAATLASQGIGFVVLNVGRGAAVAGVMPLIFLILMYLLHTLGELALSPGRTAIDLQPA